MDWMIHLSNHNCIIPIAKWPYLFVSKTETITNCYNKNIFFELLIMLENSMNRLDMAQSMVMNAGQVSWTLVFCKHHSSFEVSLILQPSLTYKNSYLLQHCRSMPRTCYLPSGIQSVPQWHKWIIVTVQAIYLREELVESVHVYVMKYLQNDHLVRNEVISK